MVKSAPAKEVRTGDVFVGVTGRKLFIDCVGIDDVSYHNEDGERGQVSRRDLLAHCNKEEPPYVSSAARQFAPGNFVTHGTSDKVGVTRDVADEMEANPLVLVKWMNDLTEEWVRSEYLYSVRVRN